MELDGHAAALEDFLVQCCDGGGSVVHFFELNVTESVIQDLVISD